MRQMLWSIVKTILRVEHIIYCSTDCKLELYLHKSYYDWRRRQYEEYLYQQQLGVAVL